jgi:4-hydroxy-L-threonine phosphate dehydrogenase PdxA
MRPKIAVTVGDINGIGPEVALKAMLKKVFAQDVNPFLFPRSKSSISIQSFCT